MTKKYIKIISTKEILEDTNGILQLLYKNNCEVFTEAENTAQELLEVKNDKKDEASYKRKIKQYSNIEYSSDYFIATESARQKLNNKLEVETGDNIQWSDAEGIITEYTHTFLSSLLLETINRDDSLYNQNSVYINSINACTTKAEVDSIIINYT